MTLAIALYFFLISAVMLGLLAVSIPFYKASNEVKPSSLWAVTLGLNGLGTFFFACSIVLITDVNQPVFLGTVANSLIVGSHFSLALFFRSLRSSGETASFKLLSGFILGFLVCYELIKLHANVQERIAGVGLISASLLLWQCIELIRNTQLRASYHLALLLVASATEAALVIARIGLIVLPEYGFETVAEVPLLIVALAWTQFALQVISYTVLNGYWTERISRENSRIDKENGVIRELSRKQEELIAALSRLNKSSATGALSASIAHELNQPLQSVRLNAEVAKKQLMTLHDPNQRGVENLLEDILRENQRAAGIVTALRGIFLNDGPEPRRFDLAEVVRSMEVLFCPLARSRDVHLAFHYDKCAFISARSEEVRQVILNIMNNAFDALEGESQRSPEVLVTVATNAGSVTCEVRDNGPGVKTEDLPDLFELFKTKKNTHMGFGLWLCRYVTERNQGSITLTNDAPSGTVVTVSFKAA